MNYSMRQPTEAKLMNVSDFDLGNDVELQFEFVRKAIESGDEDQFHNAILRVDSVRRMKKNSTLDWQAPDLGAENSS